MCRSLEFAGPSEGVHAAVVEWTGGFPNKRCEPDTEEDAATLKVLVACEIFFKRHQKEMRERGGLGRSDGGLILRSLDILWQGGQSPRRRTSLLPFTPSKHGRPTA